ncbi:MAG: hypothetical protein SWI22_10410 [Pseudomonadota bacterium]|nr:hypothetical protein [Pseudomonadota bacterium]
MVVAGRIAGLVLLVALGSVIGRHYSEISLARWLAQAWLPVCAILAVCIAFVGARPVTKAMSRYETTPPSLSGERLFLGILGVALATLVSNFMLLVGILTG